MSQLIFNKRESPPSPGSNKVSVYVKSDGELYLKKENGTEIKLSGSGAITLKVESRIITTQEAADKQIVLQSTPIEPDNISLIIGHGGGPQVRGAAFDVSPLNPTILYWQNKELDGFIEEGDVFIIHYLTIV